MVLAFPKRLRNEYLIRFLQRNQWDRVRGWDSQLATKLSTSMEVPFNACQNQGTEQYSALRYQLLSEVLRPS